MSDNTDKYSYALFSRTSANSSTFSSPTVSTSLLPRYEDSSLDDAYEEHEQYPPRRQLTRRLTDGKTARKYALWLIRLRFFPARPITIGCSLLLLAGLIVSLVKIIHRIKHPYEDPWRWRALCSVPSTSTSLYTSELLQLGTYPHVPPVSLNATHHIQHWPFFDILPHAPSPPSPPLESLPPVGIFGAVFTVDHASERRMLIRSTWASHARSRDGAGVGDGGRGTSRTVVRFIMGRPKPEWERRINAEIQMYKDIVILPIVENMNDGKTHSFFLWSALEAWVPPLYPAALLPLGETNHSSASVPPLETSYSNFTSFPPPLAPHDPMWAFLDAGRAANRTQGPNPITEPLGSGVERHGMQRWVRPDFVVKIDDDSFIMLAELEARLRMEFYAGTTASSQVGREADKDPLVYYGSMVKKPENTWIQGAMYALSWSLVDWVSKEPETRKMTRGAEDQQTSKWIKFYPGSSSGLEHRKVRWVSEQCWMYDHPRASTIYAHGFIFPSTVKQVKKTLDPFFDFSNYISSHPTTDSSTDAHARSPASDATPRRLRFSTDKLNDTPDSWAYSTISTHHRPSLPPLPSDLSFPHSVEALIEDSPLAQLRHAGGGSSSSRAQLAWDNRQGRNAQYLGERVGGTVFVHYIKKDLWYLETALALLEGEEMTEREMKELEKGSE